MLSKLFGGIRRRLTGKTRGNAGNPSLQTSGLPRFLRSLSCVEHDTVIRGQSIRTNLYSRHVESPGSPSRLSRRRSDVGSCSGPPPPSDGDSRDEPRSLIIETDSSFCTVGSTQYGSVFIYNSNWEVIVARCYAKNKAEIEYPHVRASSFEGELFALKKAMEIVDKLNLSGYENIHFKCDNVIVVKSVSDGSPPYPTQYPGLERDKKFVRETKARIAASGIDVSVTHVLRPLNKVADKIVSMVREDALLEMVNAEDHIHSYSTHASWGVEGCWVDVTHEEILKVMQPEMQRRFGYVPKS